MGFDFDLQKQGLVSTSGKRERSKGFALSPGLVLGSPGFVMIYPRSARPVIHCLQMEKSCGLAVGYRFNYSFNFLVV